MGKSIDELELELRNTRILIAALVICNSENHRLYVRDEDIISLLNQRIVIVRDEEQKSYEVIVVED